MWPSIAFQPLELVKTMHGSKPRRQPQPLKDDERADYSDYIGDQKPTDTQSVKET
jgi:hypothetical protein